MKTCKECGVEKSLDAFYKNAKMRDGHLSRCKPCIIQRHRLGVHDRSVALRAKLQAIKIERGCTDCGYREHPVALDFDHLPEFVKEHRISTLASGAKWEKIEAELAKCEVVCANCHRVRTAERLPTLDRGLAVELGPRSANAAKVSEDDVRAIRRLYAEGVKQHEIARRYGLSQVGVSNIVTRKRWQHVE